MGAIVETRIALIHIDAEGILHVKMKEKISVKQQDIVEIFDVYRKLGCDKKKVLQLMEVKSFIAIDMNTLSYASKHIKEFFIASGLISRNVGIRITYNFFNRIFNHSVPFKMFPTEAKALKWLRTFKEQ